MICLCLGMLHSATAQNELAAITDYKMAKTTTSSASDYKNSINTNMLAERALKLRTIVANYDISDSEIYKVKEKSLYTVNFKEDQNRIEAKYDTDGNIISCKEIYKNVRLPLQLSQDLIKKNEGYSIGNVICKIRYNAQKEQTINYKVELLSPTDRKIVKLQL